MIIMNENFNNKTKVCFIGFGKRTKLFYAPILKKLKDDFDLCGFTKKSEDNSEQIIKEYDIKFCNSVETLIDQFIPDLLILSVPSSEVLNILEKLNNLNCVIFIDTPFFWAAPEINDLNILVSEQWPFLPIEQFKKILINSGFLGETFYAENESRTFEYHGIAQLRNYFSKDKKISKITGSNISRPGEDWQFGIVRHQDNSGFLYKFSYYVKKCPFRPHQALKIYLTKGSIISGCLNEKGNDYEILKISQDVNGSTQHFDAQVKRSKLEINNKETSYHSGPNYYELESISCNLQNEKRIIWNNPFAGHGFNDQEIAIATLLKNAKEFIAGENALRYPAKTAAEDVLILNHIQQSSIHN